MINTGYLKLLKKKQLVNTFPILLLITLSVQAVEDVSPEVDQE